MRFLGNIEAKTDAKGRVFLPAQFRKVLQAEGETQLVMRKDIQEDCLVLYPETVWNEQMDVMSSRLNRFNKGQRAIFRQFVSAVEPLTLDASGRFLIPKRYLEMAKIDQAVRFIGVGDTIEIWAANEMEESFADADDFGATLEALMSDVNGVE